MGFCEWPVLIPAEYEERWQAASADDRQRATVLAGRVLWALTGQVFGVCPAVVRPCFQPPAHGTTWSGRAGAVFWPGVTGDPAATGPCGCSDGCREIGYDRVALPGPVAAVDEVVIDGITIDPATYRVENRRWLHRIDGQRWPTHQALHVGDDEPGAFTVRYQRGLVVPVDGQYAAGRLAVEFLAGMTGGECALPAGATSVSRQGVSVELADMREWFTNGVTGVASVDLWIMAVNPHKSKRPARITSPDAIRRRAGVL
ncbi:hypothetical protein JVX90_00295 [Gordonia sp. PDNC005]|uniref:hypothetical protein n=1 Tax=Gordonia sp. PDNC005 TaxID=2811424 RepID=UPI001966B8E0|nr:hypothetical protein [Gordonia sp. PDNC005]QRY62752.1 hypothetical protein JVX90_00295 [Gordonia sp. PDNC005]